MDTTKKDNRKSRAIKGLMGMLNKSKSPKKVAPETLSAKEDETNDNEMNISANSSLASLSDSSSNEYDKITIDYETLAISDEFSQGKFTSLCHAEWRNHEVAVVKAKDDDTITLQNMEYQTQLIMELKSHRNIWRCIGAGADGLSPPCLVMEPVYGFLDDLIHGTITNLDAKTIVKFAKQIANGMQYLHSQNIIHGDLGCRSVMYDKIHDQYILKISGFDLSCYENDTTKITELKRMEHWSPRWAAPEVLEHNKLSKATDVWSFGVLLWELSERRRPYEGMSPAQVKEGVCHHRLRLADPYRAAIPADLVKLIRECWEEPQYRPTFDEICVALANLT